MKNDPYRSAATTREKRRRTAEEGKSVVARRKDIMDLRGRRFSRLVVLELAPVIETAQYGASWVCRCDCGTIKRVRATHLLSAETKSCGCWRKEVAKTRTFKKE